MTKPKIIGFSLGEVVHLRGKPYYIAWIESEEIGLTSMCERKYYLTTTWKELIANEQRRIRRTKKKTRRS